MPVYTCPNCGGDGKVNGRGGHQVNCPLCHGSGKIQVSPLDRSK